MDEQKDEHHSNYPQPNRNNSIFWDVRAGFFRKIEQVLPIHGFYSYSTGITRNVVIILNLIANYKRVF